MCKSYAARTFLYQIKIGYNPAGADMGAGGAAGNGGITSDSDDFSDINAPSKNYEIRTTFGH